MATPDFFEVLGRFQDFLIAGDHEPKTIASYSDYIARAGRIARKDPRSFTPDDVDAVLASYSDRGPAMGQMKRAMRCFYRWAEDRELLVNPARHVKIHNRRPTGNPDLTDAEIARVLIAATTIGDDRAPWALMLAFATGARLASLVGVRACDVRGELIHFRIAKGRRPYSVPLGPMGRQAIAELLALSTYTPARSNGRRDTLLGVGEGRFWQWVHLSSEASGIHVWPHLFRHAAATRWARTTDPKTWMALGNWSDLSQYDRYVARDEARLRAAAL